MMMTNFDAGMGSFFGIACGVSMMAVPVILIAGLAYLIFRRPQNVAY